METLAAGGKSAGLGLSISSAAWVIFSFTAISKAAARML